MDIESLKNVCRQTPTDESLHEAWVKVLEKPSAQAKIGELVREADELRNSVIMSPLDTQEEVDLVRKQKERLGGLERALEILLQEYDDGEYQRAI